MPGTIGSTLATGLILAAVNALITVALASLIFRGVLSDSLPIGIGLGLISSGVIALVIALGSSFPGVYSGIQDAPSAIIGVSAAALAGAMAGSVLLDSVLVLIALTSLATGLGFLAMGYLGWGEIARFVPFPVIGGLLAGTGYLIITGALAILAIGSIQDLTASPALGLMWPAVLLGGLLFVAARRGWGSRIYLLFLVTGVVIFHLAVGLGGVTRAEAFDRGWMLGPFPDGSLWPGSVISSFAGADWSAIAGQIPAAVTILVIVPISLLLYISALEVETRVDVDMNRELRATGWANVAAAAVGGPPGYMYLADTVIAARLVGQRRGPAVVTPVAMLVLVASGGAVLEYVPQFLIGGLLLFVGAEFMYEWLWASRRTMSGPDYVLVWGIVLIIAVVGFLPGVVVGLVLATGLFVFRYSRVDVVKHELSGADHQSNIERSVADAEFLGVAGAAIHILELQGFIFFGTANRILSRVKTLLRGSTPPRYLILDFRRVTGIDSSAMATFERLALLAADRGLAILFTGLSETPAAQFGDLVAAHARVVRVHPDLDHGVAWCEEELLREAGRAESTSQPLPPDLPRALADYLVEDSFAPGQLLMSQGDPSPGIFLIRSGRATVYIDGADGGRVRLRTLLSGTVLGEISLYRNEPCTATVVADEECGVLHLSPGAFAELCDSDPRVAAELHAFVVRTLAGRVSYANRAIRALHD